MRKINTGKFRLATRWTPRDVNRRIVLNLIRECQPISRAELARRMKVRRGALTAIVRELLEASEVQELGSAAITARGRRPTLLAIRSGGQLIAAADVRPSTTYLALIDQAGFPVVRDKIETPELAELLPQVLAEGLSRLVSTYAPGATVKQVCRGLGVVVPGMIDRKTGRLIYAPRLGWRDVEIRGAVEKRLGVKTFLESAPIACALARLWLAPDETRTVQSFAYVHVSDGLGVGLVVNGEPLRGDTHSAGEFGHICLDPNGPECACGQRGCWEALSCNATTINRYLTQGRAIAEQSVLVSAGAHARRIRSSRVTINEVVRRAERGDQAAIDALAETASNIGRGLTLIVNAFNPGRIYIGGEVTAAWGILAGPIRAAIARGAVTTAAQLTPVVPDGKPAEYRLRGAAALVMAPVYAALAVG